MKEGILEGMLFLRGSEGLTLLDMERILQIEEKEALKLIDNLKERYKDSTFGINITKYGNFYKLVTKKEYEEYFKELVDKEINNPLSSASLECLAIIAYNEPITALGVEEIRGVNSRELIRKLEAKELIEKCGKSNDIGKPTLYRTAPNFLDFFGIESLNELPKINK